MNGPLSMNDLRALFVPLRTDYGADPEVLASWQRSIAAISDSAGSMKLWMKTHARASVETFRITVSPVRGWITGPRHVFPQETWVELDGARRHYQGLRHLGSDQTTLVVSDEHTVIIYRC